MGRVRFSGAPRENSPGGPFAGCPPARGLGQQIFEAGPGPAGRGGDPEVGELWHILAAGLPLDFPAPKPGESGPELAARARAAGAFVAIAHPAWSQLRIGDGRALDSAHAVEVYNHGCAVETDRGDGFYLLDELLNEGRRLSAIATDDAHFRNGDHDAFGGFVEVKAESLDPDALLASLKAGRFYSSQGPRLFDIEVGPGEVSVSCSPVNSIALLTGNSRALVKVGRYVTSVAFDVVGARQQASANPPEWFRIVAVDAAGRRAWTNPIWTTNSPPRDSRADPHVSYSRTRRGG